MTDKRTEKLKQDPKENLSDERVNTPLNQPEDLSLQLIEAQYALKNTKAKKNAKSLDRKSVV